EAASAVDVPNGKRRRRKKESLPEDLAVALEPSPDEMPGVDPVLASAMSPAMPDAQSKTERKTKRARDDAATPEERVASEMHATEHSAATALMERPPKHLLSAPPPKNVEVNRRELDAAGAKLMDALR